MVAILDADKQGFLRSETSLIQTIGRSARNANAKVILYGDKVTEAMKNAIDETARRRKIQEAYNREHNITPQTIKKNIADGIESDLQAHREANEMIGRDGDEVYITEEHVNELQTEMLQAAENLDFERAASLRDQISQMKNSIGEPMSSVSSTKASYKKGRGRRKKGRRGKVPRPRNQK